MLVDKSYTLASLGESIKDLASNLQQLLSENQLPQPTFSAAGRRDWSDAQFFPSVLTARSNLIDAAQKLLDLAMGPTDILAAYAGPRASEIEVLRTINSLQIADKVPLDGDISISDLAAKTSVKNEAALEKHMRFAYLMGLFRQTQDGKVAHTALSAALPENSAWVSLRLGKLFSQGAHEIANAIRMETHPEDGAIPCAMADPKGLSRTCYQQLEDDPDGKGMERFSKGMISLFTLHAGGTYTPFVHGFDWASLSEGATVVDVGGGNGHIEANIAPHVPGINFVIQDVATNEAPARHMIERQGLVDRVQFQPHDFFLPQPELPGGQTPSAYLLIRVLQDWSNTDCGRILKPLIPAMERSGTKLWIMNRILPDDLHTMPVHQEKLMRTLDLLAFTLSGGGERSASNLHKMLASVDGRLRVKTITRPLYSVFSFIEVVLDV